MLGQEASREGGRGGVGPGLTERRETSAMAWQRGEVHAKEEGLSKHGHEGRMLEVVERGGRRVPRKALETGDSVGQKQEGVREGVRGYEPERLGQLEARLSLKKRETVKGDSNQRRLFSEPHGRGGPLNQNKLAEEQNLLLDKLSSHRVAQSLTDKPAKSTPMRLNSPQGQRTGRGRNPFSNEEGFPQPRMFEVDLGSFNPEVYLAGQRLEEGGDEMKRFQFNQRRSEMTPYNRILGDVRNPRYLHVCVSPTISPHMKTPPCHLSAAAPVQRWTTRLGCKPPVSSSVSTMRRGLPC